MPFEPDDERAELPDRIISDVIAGLCGFALGSVLAWIAGLFWGGGSIIAWLVTIGAAGFGFFEPNRSRALWTELCDELINLLGSKR